MIQILCFAHVAEELGTRQFELESGIEVADIRNYLAERGVSASERLMFAVNECYVLDTHRVETGDTVAVIPVVSGG